MNSDLWLNASLWLPLVQALLHTLWQGALLAGGLFLILRWIPARRVNLRYNLCLGALLGLLLLGFGSWAMLDTSRKTVETSRTSGVPVGIAGGVTAQAAPPVVLTANAVEEKTTEAIVKNVAGNSWSKWVAAFWMLGVLVCLVRTTLNVLGAGRLRRRCQELTDSRILTLVEELRTRLCLSRPVRLLISADIQVPAVLGVIWPAILLPAAMLSGLPLDQLRAILAHELSHIRRWDYLVNLGQMLIEALLFFNPFVWWISRQVRLEREACCDQVAAAECPSAVHYVEALVAVIEGHRATVPQPMLAASGLDDGSQKSHALDRARRLLMPEYLPRLRLQWFSLAAVLILSALALGGLWTSARAVAQKIQPSQETAAKEAVAQASPAVDDDFLCKVRVSTPDGKPLAFDSAVVRVYTAMTNSSRESSSHVETDGIAPVWISAKASTATLVASKEGFAPAFYGPFSPPLKEKLDGLRVQLREGFAASIQTIDALGQSIAGAQVIGYYPGRPMVELPAVQSDATGTATMEHLAEGPLNVRVRAEGFEGDELVGVRLNPAKPYRWTLKKASPLRGTVTTSDGGRVAGATIKLAGVVGPHNETHFDPRQAPLLTTTDARGDFTLTTLRPDSRYYFFVEAPGHGSVFLRNIKREQGILQVTLGPELSLRGKIVHVPPSMLYKDKFNLTYGQTFRIGNSYTAVSQELEDLKPKDGEVDFNVSGFFTKRGEPEPGPEDALDKDLASLSVRAKYVTIPIAELPKTDFVFDLGGDPVAADQAATAQPVKDSLPPAQPSIEIESKFLEIPDAVAKGLTFPRADSLMDKFPGTTLTAGTAVALGTVLSEKDAEELLRQLSSQPGIEILSAPRITTHSQQRGVVEVVREFRYPTQYEFDKTREGQPATPTAFETRKVGVTLEAEASIQEGGTINLKLKPQVVEFLGFISYPSGETLPVKREPGEKFSDRLAEIKLPAEKPFAPNEIRQPVFSTRQTTSDVTIHSGQTVVFLGSGETAMKGFEQPSAGKQLLVLVRASLAKVGEPSDVPKLDGAASNPQPASNLPTGTAVEGKPGFVISPHSPKAGYIDVRGFASGAEVQDPYSEKMFRLP